MGNSSAAVPAYHQGAVTWERKKELSTEPWGGQGSGRLQEGGDAGVENPRIAGSHAGGKEQGPWKKACSWY